MEPATLAQITKKVNGFEGKGQNIGKIEIKENCHSRPDRESRKTVKVA